MFEDKLSSIVNSLVPSKEDINNISKKLDHNEQLTPYDYIVLDKVRLINLIIKSKGERI